MLHLATIQHSRNNRDDGAENEEKKHRGQRQNASSKNCELYYRRLFQFSLVDKL